MISPVLFFWFPEMYTTPLLAVLSCFLQSNIINVLFYPCYVLIVRAAYLQDDCWPGQCRHQGLASEILQGLHRHQGI